MRSTNTRMAATSSTPLLAGWRGCYSLVMDNGLIRINRIEIGFTDRAGLEEQAGRQP